MTMFGLNFLYRKAQATVDNAIAQLVWGVLMALPLLVALGFATAAAANYLHKLYEPEIANLIVAGAFALLGVIMAIAYAMRTPETAASEEAKAEAEEAAAGANGGGSEPGPSWSPADREVLLSALTTAAPFAVRPLAGALFRNLPVLLAIAVTVFVLTRATAGPTGDVATPAE